MIFTGHSELTIDAKGRLAIPSKWRELLGPADTRVPLFLVPWEGRLLIFAEDRFKQLSELQGATLTPGAEDHQGPTTYFSFAERVMTDSEDRVIVPRLHLELTGLSREVVMVGAGPRLEVWERTAWTANLKDRFRLMPERMRQLEKRADPTL